MAARQYAYQKEREGYSIWTVGLSGSRQDLIAYARTAREAQRKIDTLHAKDEARSTSSSTRHHAMKKKSPAQLEREIAEALATKHDSRVVVFGEPGSPPLYVSPWMTKAEADRQVRHHRTLNRERGHDDYEVVLEPRWMVEEREEYERRHSAKARTIGMSHRSANDLLQYAQERANATRRPYAISKMGHVMLADAHNKKAMRDELGGIATIVKPSRG